jgi:hypothetical protein
MLSIGSKTLSLWTTLVIKIDGSNKRYTKKPLYLKENFIICLKLILVSILVKFYAIRIKYHFFPQLINFEVISSIAMITFRNKAID